MLAIERQDRYDGRVGSGPYTAAPLHNAEDPGQVTAGLDVSAPPFSPITSLPHHLPRESTHAA